MNIQINAQVMESINYAAVNCGKKVVENLEIAGDYSGKVICRIYAEPAFCFEYKTETVLEAGRPYKCNPKLNLDAAFYRSELVEGKSGEVKIEILSAEEPDKILGFKHFPVHIEAYLQWDGVRYPYTMPAFMQPNDPLVLEIKGRASKYAVENGIEMYGYQGKNPEDALMQAKCIYDALADSKLYYGDPAASFEERGQKILIPKSVLENRTKNGTCLDLAILYASCLEAAGLNSLLVVIRGHAFAGVWLDPNVILPKGMLTKDELTEEEWQKIQNYAVPVECTTFTEGERKCSFESAVKIGKKNIVECRYVIDVRVARNLDPKILPAYTWTDKPICDSGEAPENIIDMDTEMVDNSSEVPERTIDVEVGPVGNSKYEILKKQAMDISARNKLLSGRGERHEITFELDSNKYMDGGYTAEELCLKMQDYVYGKGITEEALQKDLHKLRLNDREVRREKGQGNLFVALNYLEWKTKEKNQTCKAVLYLCPAEVCLNKRGEYFFKADRENMRFNPVLKEMLYQDFKIDIRDMKDFPVEEYKNQMEMLRYRIEKKKDWKVVENTARVGAFTIPNEAIWKGLEEERVLNHEIVKSILEENMTWEDLEETKVQEDKVYAFQADSSQAEVVEKAFSMKAQVVRGPAGNGKTQCIANIMSTAIAKGEKVLFVSEKPAALSVAQDMMEDAGLGAFCLSVVGGVDSFKDVSGKISNMLRYQENHELAEEEYVGNIPRYQAAYEKLSQYHKLMKEKGSCGKSMEELYRMYNQYRLCKVDLDWKNSALGNSLSESEDLIEKYAEITKIYMPERKKYMSYVRYEEMTEAEKSEAEKLVPMALDSWERLEKTIDGFEAELGSLSAKNKRDRIGNALNYAEHLKECPAFEAVLEKHEGTDNVEEEAKLKVRIFEIINEMKYAGKKQLRGLEKELEDELSPYLNRNTLRALVHSAPEVLTEKVKVLSLTSEPGVKANNDSILSQKEFYNKYMEEFEKRTQNYSQEQKRYLTEAVKMINSGKKTGLKEIAESVDAIYSEYLTLQEKLEKLVVRDSRKFLEDHPEELRKELFVAWNQIHMSDKGQKIYNKVVAHAEKENLGYIIKQLEDKLENKEIAQEDFLPAFRKCWCKYQIEQLKKEFPDLEQFDSLEYQMNVRHYCEEEEKIRQDIREDIISQQWKHLPNVKKGTKGSLELANLQKVVGKVKKGSIRSVFEQAPNVILNYYPCIMMNPSAVAEYLPKDFPEFDLVIIDEGSQLPCYKALIPISYGKRCMIFGDEMQLTPTKFFERMMEDEDGDPTSVESILQSAIYTNMPRTMLRYHYRSEDESLISFSNAKYYNYDMVTFPSKTTKITGIFYDYVEDGCYDRGGTKTNHQEALRVVKKAYEIFEKLPKESGETIGIITMNLNQKNLIQSLLMEEAVNNTLFGHYVDEYVSVVNLEACQGKEWEHVILSTGYGRDAEGGFSTNLGALNHEGGRNRLNVMLTRARKSMHVVTSLTPEMFGDGVSEGVADLKEFLSYARKDFQFDTRKQKAEKQYVYSLAESIAEELRGKGYIVHTNIGSSRCKVDLGIVSEKNPDEYVLGILLDDFRESKNGVRDREIIRPAALKQKGWEIYRLHSINWYEDSNYEMKNIESKIKAAEAHKR